MKERVEHGGNVAATREIRLGHAIDEGLRWIIADETDGEFTGEEMRGGRAGGEHVEQLAAFQFAVVLELLTHDLFGSGLVAVSVKFEFAGTGGAVDGPSGENARHLRDVGLGVAAVDAQSVQFHKLTSVVFIEALGSFSLGVR